MAKMKVQDVFDAIGVNLDELDERLEGAARRSEVLSKEEVAASYLKNSGTRIEPVFHGDVQARQLAASTPAVLAEGYYTHTNVRDGYGVGGFIRFATIRIKQAHVNVRIVMEFFQRHLKYGVLYIGFVNAGDTDPALSSLAYTGSTAGLYIAKREPSVWELYIRKAENYDWCSFNLKSNGRYTEGRYTIEWEDSWAESLPARAIQAGPHEMDMVASHAARVGNALTVDLDGMQYAFDGSAPVAVEVVGKGALAAFDTVRVQFPPEQAAERKYREVVWLKSYAGAGSGTTRAVFRVESVYGASGSKEYGIYSLSLRRNSGVVSLSNADGTRLCLIDCSPGYLTAGNRFDMVCVMDKLESIESQSIARLYISPNYAYGIYAITPIWGGREGSVGQQAYGVLWKCVSSDESELLDVKDIDKSYPVPYVVNALHAGNVLMTENEWEYKPTKPYHPATKGYVDEKDDVLKGAMWRSYTFTRETTFVPSGTSQVANPVVYIPTGNTTDNFRLSEVALMNGEGIYIPLNNMAAGTEYPCYMITSAKYASDGRFALTLRVTVPEGQDFRNMIRATFCYMDGR